MDQSVGDQLDPIRAFLQPPVASGMPARFMHFEVRRVLGHGASGVVLEAFDDILRRNVAIKVLSPTLADNATARKRFLREGRATAVVIHENVVGVYTVGEQPIPHLVMEYVEGPTLQEYLDRHGPMSPGNVIRLGRQIASGLAAAHAHGIIHRDVKPANILLQRFEISNDAQTFNFTTKIADFGLARAVGDDSLTQEGVILGTPAFFAPEQAQDREVDHRSDLFSLGSVLYAMCTGQPPFAAPTSVATMKRICDEAPPSIRAVNSTVPDALAAIIKKLLEKDPTQRYQSAAEVALALDDRLAAEELVVSSRSALGSLAAWRKHLLIGTALVVAAAGALYLLLRGGKPEQILPIAAVSEPPGKASPADALERADIPADLLANVGAGDPAQAPPELVAVLAGHSAQVNQLAYSPDGATLASAADDGTVRLWDMETGKECKILEGTKGKVFSVAYNPTGTVLASGGEDGLVRLWDAASGQLLQELSHSDKSVQFLSVAFSPDGKWLLSAAFRGNAKLWDAATGREAHVLPKGEPWNVAFSPDSTRAVVGYEDGEIHLYDPATGADVVALQPRQRRVVRALAFEPTGRFLAPGNQWSDGNIHVWDLTSHREVYVLRGHKNWVVSCAWSADGRFLASAGDIETVDPANDTDRTVRLWDMTPLLTTPSGEEPRPARSKVINVPSGGLRCLTLSPEGRYAAVGTRTGSNENPTGLICILRLAKRGETMPFPKPSGR